MALFTLIDLIFLLAALFTVGYFAVRYVPWCRHLYQRWSGEVVRQEAQYWCKHHGKLSPLAVCEDMTGALVCKHCYANHVVEKVAPLANARRFDPQ